MIKAPFSPTQVEALNFYQDSDVAHPFTCARPHGKEQKLYADVDGWHCSDPICTYTQDWAHSFMADKPLLEKVLADRKAVLERKNGHSV